MKRTISHFRRTAAKKLREETTKPEEKLWHALKRIPLYGTHFRRQVPIGPYVADFACMTARLIIELDGSQHGFEENIAKDEVRTNWLEKEGFTILRFWNKDVFDNIDAVLATIYLTLHGAVDIEVKLFTPPRRAFARRPSPSRGG